jgi:hypothetical protein
MRACVFNINLGALGVVLSWPRRKSDHERVRGHRGGLSEWREPGRVRAPKPLARHLFGGVFFSCIIHMLFPCFLASSIHASWTWAVPKDYQ